ncbi:MAG: hypothetical protein HQL39_16820, partial [Alphaproteobacteria bacterium]|nr:hypothetical protein [Alphaproteobacteria bacterium]
MPAATRPTFDRRSIFRQAWSLARENVRTFGGSLRTRFASALRGVWARVKRDALPVLVDMPAGLRTVALRHRAKYRTPVGDG